LHVCGYVYRGFLGEEYEQVKFRGHLEDIEREYAEAAIVINPSWIGTGLKIKTVEALARGKPLVTTTKGIEGMDRDVEKSTFVCDDAVKFADAVTRLLQDPHVRNNLSHAAKQFAIRHLNAGAVYGELLTYLDEQRRDLTNNHSHGRKMPPVLESTR
jgi:glycosyltransferase involved in cell wall biosynthesis